jgi:hypothetical protein
MTEQQSSHRPKPRETLTHRIQGVDDVRAKKALDDRCKAVTRWIGEDDDSCCRGID